MIGRALHTAAPTTSPEPTARLGGTQAPMRPCTAASAPGRGPRLGGRTARVGRTSSRARGARHAYRSDVVADVTCSPPVSVGRRRGREVLAARVGRTSSRARGARHAYRSDVVADERCSPRISVGRHRRQAALDLRPPPGRRVSLPCATLTIGVPRRLRPPRPAVHRRPRRTHRVRHSHRLTLAQGRRPSPWNSSGRRRGPECSRPAPRSIDFGDRPRSPSATFHRFRGQAPLAERHVPSISGTGPARPGPRSIDFGDRPRSPWAPSDRRAGRAAHALRLVRPPRRPGGPRPAPRPTAAQTGRPTPCASSDRRADRASHALRPVRPRRGPCLPAHRGGLAGRDIRRGRSSARHVSGSSRTGTGVGRRPAVDGGQGTGVGRRPAVHREQPPAWRPVGGRGPYSGSRRAASGAKAGMHTA